MTTLTLMQTDTEIAPTYTVPFSAIGLILFFVTLFGGTFAILPYAVPDASAILKASGVVAVVIVLFSWLGLIRAWGTRRMFSGCRLVLADGFVKPERACRFKIQDLRHRLTRESRLRFALSYQDEFRRSGGRKIYREGPYVLDTEVHSKLVETQAFPVVEGQFTLSANQIKLNPPDRNWESRTFVILTMQVDSGRRCKFELPCSSGSSI